MAKHVARLARPAQGRHKAGPRLVPERVTFRLVIEQRYGHIIMPSATHLQLCPIPGMSDPEPETRVGHSHRTRQLRRSPAGLVLRLRAASAAMIRLAASEAEGRVV